MIDLDIETLNIIDIIIYIDCIYIYILIANLTNNHYVPATPRKDTCDRQYVPALPFLPVLDGLLTLPIPQAPDVTGSTRSTRPRPNHGNRQGR